MEIATEVHSGELRKGTAIPYLSHIWSVGALVLEHGGDDAQVAAGLLHDTVEDGGGTAMLERLQAEFPDTDVADLVEHLSDSVVDTTTGAVKADWRTRKRRYLAEVAQADGRVLLVSACDKLHNARCILADHRVHGVELWKRFNQADPAAHLWYYDSLAHIFAGRVPPPLGDELRRTVDELFRAVERDVPDLHERMAAYRDDESS